MILFILLLLFFTGCESKTPEQQIAEYATLFNQYRADHGLSPLEFTDDLNRLASLRLDEIKKDFSHDSAGRYKNHIGENLVKGIKNNEEALICWDNSPGHQYNLLVDYKYTGYATDDGYAVQLFSYYITVNGIPQLPEGYYWPGEEETEVITPRNEMNFYSEIFK